MIIDVLKFGGTSVADATALRAVLGILSQRVLEGNKLLVVLSATAGTTNALLAVAGAAAQQDGQSVANSLSELRQRHLAIVDALIDDASLRAQASQRVASLVDSLEEYCHGITLLAECTPQSYDEVVSFGERISTSIVTYACLAMGIEAQWLDARHVVATDATYQAAVVNMNVTESRCNLIAGLFANAHVIVTQGFIGGAPDGTTTTLGRGGSDYSAAILGAGCGARIIDIYTDVSGVLTADPRIEPNATPIGSLDVSMMRELALYGAKVLHPDTIVPAIHRQIPVRVVNTFRPQATGTVITERGTDKSVVAVTGIQHCMRIEVAAADAQEANLALHRRGCLILQHTSTLLRDAFVVQRTPLVSALDIESLVANISTSTSECSLVVACSNTALSHDAISRALAGVTALPVIDALWFPHGRSLALCVRAEAYADAVRGLHHVFAAA